MFICNAVMTIDKSWTTISNRNSDAFLDGLFAFSKHCEPLLHPITQKIRCPCSRSCNRDDNFVTLKTLEEHISSHGFDQHYTTWKYHGEPTLPLPPPIPHSPEHIDMDAFFKDISANNVPTPPTQTTGPQPAQTTGPNNEFEELLSRSTQKLYPGCDMTTLEFTTEISHIKALHKITDAGFNKILALLQKACSPSKGYNFPSSYYEIKKTYKKIGLGYESIHACINDCFLFWGSEDNLKMPNCPICKASRWKDPKKTKGKKVANKVVRYFPLTPRLQRMFNTKHIAKWMTWHATGQSKENGKMNHPCDGKAWKYFDMMKPEFSGDPRNVRLGLAADGFNPFGMMSQNYSMWPVILTTYNTPPWMCMKETSLMLTMLIPGPKSPAKDIDVYGQLEEILELTYIGIVLIITDLEYKITESVWKWSPTVNVDNANANECNADDDDVALVLDDDVDVVFFFIGCCVFPRSHGGDDGAKGSRADHFQVMVSARWQGIIFSHKKECGETEPKDVWNKLDMKSSIRSVIFTFQDVDNEKIDNQEWVVFDEMPERSEVENYVKTDEDNVVECDFRSLVQEDLGSSVVDVGEMKVEEEDVICEDDYDDDWQGIETTELEKSFGAAMAFMGSKSSDERMDNHLYGGI
ncbi:CACTA transposable element [Tanacetum coccineum]